MIRYLFVSCLWMILLYGSAAQSPATPTTGYKDIARQRLLLMSTCKFIYVSSQGQMDEDSAMLFACHMYGLSRLLPYNEGYSDGTPSAGSRLIDAGKLYAATALLNTRTGNERMQLLLELGAYYLFRPGTDKKDLDSALLYIRAADSFSKSMASPAWQNESQALLGKYYCQAGNRAEGQACLSRIVEACRQKGDRRGLAIALLDRGGYFPFGDPRRLAVFEESLALFRQLQLKEKEIEALSQVLTEHYVAGSKAAEKELFQLLDLQKAIGFHQHQYAHTTLAYIFFQRADYMNAMVHATKAVESMQPGGDFVLAPLFYMRRGDVDMARGKPQAAMDWYRKSLVGKTKETQVFWYKSFFCLLQALLSMNLNEKAMDLLQEVSAEFPPLTLYDKMHLALKRGLCYMRAGQYELAEQNFTLFASLAEHFPPQHIYGEMPDSYYRISIYYIDRGNMPKAKLYLDKALALSAGQHSVLIRQKMNWVQYRLDSAAGNYSSALAHYQEYKLYSDSIFGISQRKNLDELQVRYETEKKDKDILLLNRQTELGNKNLAEARLQLQLEEQSKLAALRLSKSETEKRDKDLIVQQQKITLLNQEGLLQQSRLQQATTGRNILIGGAALLLLLMVLGYNRYRAKQKVNERLQLQREEISRKNKSLQQLLNEKEWLLKEIHHRVKNNLHTVVSLLESQSAYLENDALAANRDSQHRVYAMSLIHQKLYLSENMTTVHMPSYLDELVIYLRDSFSVGQRIRFQLDIEPLDLDVAQVIPLGLILNEAITNAIKYAFPGNANGLIVISLAQEKDQILLTITDNGTGLPPHFDKANAGSLGMRLMKGLSREIDASFVLESNKGTAVTITFPIDRTLQYA